MTPTPADSGELLSITPAAPPPDEGALAREVEEFFHQKRQERRPYEQTWALNATALRGKSKSRWQHIIDRLAQDKAPPHRRHMNINLVWSKFAAKVAKLVNARPRPVVIAASQDRDDQLNARASQQALLYASRKVGLEEKYEQAVGTAEITGKSYLWVSWNPTATGRVKDPVSGRVETLPLGDVQLEAGSPFELLVEDLGQPLLGKQRRIMRIGAMLISDAQRRYAKLAALDLKSDVNEEELFQFERQIANLGSEGSYGAPPSGDTQKVKGNAKAYVLRKELFTAPSDQYPLGRYTTVIAGQVVRHQDELPYGFGTIADSPWPVEEISSDYSPLQYYPQTMLERLRGLQDAVDTIISKILEDLDLSLHPKWLIPKAARIPTTALNSEGGEKVYYQYLPGMPPPQMVQPRGVNADAWRMLDRLINFYHEVTNIFPASVGGVGGAESGFQTNLLQEAADAVYGPHKRRNERSLERLLFKMRRLMKMGYDVPRLVTVAGKSESAAVIEFAADQIDEHAEIQVQIGSALSDLKATRLQQIIELVGSGLLGPQTDPRVKRAALQYVDLGGIEQEVDPTQRDQDRARDENLLASQAREVPPPLPWQTDAVHVEVHFEQMNGPDFDTWPTPAKVALIEHTILHLRKHNPVLGLEMAQLIGHQELVGELTAIVQSQQPPPMEAPPPPQGETPPAPPLAA